VSGTLYVVGTPIGNLDDMTLRAIQALRAADLIAAEDTRTTIRLLKRHAIDRPLTSVHEHSPPAVLERILGTLREGKCVAYVSEAGTPSISDPGAALVSLVREQGVPVVPVPGASALATAWSVAGLGATEFRFVGFLPASPKLRRRRLRALVEEDCPLVFYEAPHRAARMLTDLQAILGDRELVVARELTKLHEETGWSTVSTLQKRFAAQPPRGEITLIVTASGC
jgi:16S rRNA (cytidine1402-2'-O)-methyltransferase